MRRLALSLIVSALAIMSALAQETPAPEAAENGEIAFEGGKLAIIDAGGEGESQRAVTFDGKEIARNFLAFFDQVANVGGVNVALFSLSNGGNACLPATLIVWKEEAELKTQLVGDECGDAPAGVSEEGVYFVPKLSPGASADVKVWTPEFGLQVAGKMSFTPQPGTGWDQLKTGEPGYSYKALDNAAVYGAAQQLLGDALPGFAEGLMTSGKMERLETGIVVGDGCVPHDCGSRDSFLAIDPEDQKLYVAQKIEGGGEPRAWPDVGEWPPEALEAMHKAIVGN